MYLSGAEQKLCLRVTKTGEGARFNQIPGIYNLHYKHVRASNRWFVIQETRKIVVPSQGIPKTETWHRVNYDGAHDWVLENSDIALQYFYLNIEDPGIGAPPKELPDVPEIPSEPIVAYQAPSGQNTSGGPKGNDPAAGTGGEPPSASTKISPVLLIAGLAALGAGTYFIMKKRS